MTSASWTSHRLRKDRDDALASRARAAGEADVQFWKIPLFLKLANQSLAAFSPHLTSTGRKPNVNLTKQNEHASSQFSSHYHDDSLYIYKATVVSANVVQLTCCDTISTPTMSTTMATVTEAVELQTISKANLQDPSIRYTTPFVDSARTLGASQPHGISDSDSDSSSLSVKKASNLQTFLTIFTPSFVGFLASFTNGVVTIGLPEIARSLSLDRSLYLWPSSVYGLTSGACLLIAGSIADIVGARPVELLGITLIGAFTLACGFSSAGEQLVVFRALQGVALAMHLPASVALISGAVPSGRARNLGFACLGFSQPLGFAVGLVISGVLVEKAGWRSGFYLSGGTLLTTAAAAVWTLPKIKTGSQDGLLILAKKVGREVDWIGGMISSGGLAILAYVLA